MTISLARLCLAKWAVRHPAETLAGLINRRVSICGKRDVQAFGLTPKSLLVAIAGRWLASDRWRGDIESSISKARW